MGSFLSTDTISIRVPNRKSDALSRVRQLNRELEELAERFQDLNFMVYGFNEDDFHDDIVVVAKATYVTNSFGTKVTLMAGQLIYREYAEARGVPFMEESEWRSAESAKP